MNLPRIADTFLLVGIPALMAVAMTVATFTSGNPPVGLAIGWTATVAWGVIGTLGLIRRGP